MNRVMEQLRAILLRDGADLTDGELLECYLSRRDEVAFEALVRRHGPMVLGVCHRVLRHHQDSEDAFQATFLVLARKAASVLPREMVGNWLYGVALRTALKAKGATTKRRVRERQVIEMPEPEAPEEDTWRYLQPVLDHELSRLPDKYRVPIILCGLEGKTEKEAARQLGWPQGTLSGRLSRGRTMLAKRLARRGLLLSAGSLTGMLSQDAATASVPAFLLLPTVKAATQFAARQAVATGLVSAEVAALTKGVLTAMFLSKVKILMALLLTAVVLASGTGLLLSRASAPDAQAKKQQATAGDIQERNTPPAAAPEETDKVAVGSAEVGNVYQTNVALFDEMFLNKRLAVTGVMSRITRIIFLKPQGHGCRYLLDMKSNFGGPTLRFQFSEVDRKSLAKLKGGQQVTIEGVPRDVPNEETIVDFDNCKVVKPKADD